MQEVDLLDTMLSSLVELLEEKGIVTQQEWEKHKKRVLRLDIFRADRHGLKWVFRNSFAYAPK